MNRDSILEVKNRSNSMVAYRTTTYGSKLLQPGETIRVSYDEMEKLSNEPGGKYLMANYLLIKEAEAVKELNMKTEPEYYLNEQQIVDLLKNGSLDQFLDCLDFAPSGVLELIKDYSVKLPLEDYNKRQAINKKFGFDIDKAIEVYKEEQEEKAPAAQPERRVTTDSATTGRRTSGKYNIVK